MKMKTCAVCDCALDENALTITIGGKTVEVCCEDCAETLRQAEAAAQAASAGARQHR